MSLRDAEKKLYGISGGDVSKKETLTGKQQAFEEQEPVKTNWEEKPEQENAEKVVYGYKTRQMEIFSKTAFWLLFVLFLVGAGTAYYLVRQYGKTKDFDFSFQAPDEVMIGQPFEVSFKIDNKSQGALEAAKILITLPEGVIALDRNNNSLQTIEEGLDNIAVGSGAEGKYRLAIIRGDQPIERIEAVFSYLPPNLNTRFEKRTSYEIRADQPAVALNLTLPQKVFSREGFDINVNYKNVSSYDFAPFKIKMVYPDNFAFQNASASSTLNNNIWSWDKLSGGAENNFFIKGYLTATDQSFFDIKAQAFAVFNNQEYLISEKSATLNVAASPLSLTILANENSSLVVGLDNDLTYKIIYKNNTDVVLNDAVIKARLIGEMFDLASLRSKGNFDSVSNTITWNAGSEPSLRAIPPSVQGQVEFSIKTKKSYPIKRLFDKNFTLKVQAAIDSPTVPANVSSDKTAAVANLILKVSGKAEIIVSWERLKGPYPAKVNEPTDFAVHWQIRNYSTDIKDVKVNSFLQSGASWLNVVKSNVDALPIYNERTGEVSWQIPKILATKGVISKPVEGVFNIEIVPNITQFQQPLNLTGETNISAVDDFTNIELTNKAEVLKLSDNVAK